MRRARSKSIAVLFVALLAGAALAAVVGYGASMIGTAILPNAQDSPLPPPESPVDTPVVTDTIDTPTPTPTAANSSPVFIEVEWYDAAGGLLGEPPTDLPTEFKVAAQSDLGTATCAYPAASSDLVCDYSHQDSAGDGSGLWIQSGSVYTVAQAGLPEGWRSFAGTGTFRGSSPLTHTVHNRAPGAPLPTSTPTPVPPTPASLGNVSPPKPPVEKPTPKPPTPAQSDPTATPELPTPTPPEPTATPEPPTPTPPEPTATPEPPTATLPAPTATLEPPLLTPAEAAQAGEDLAPSEATSVSGGACDVVLYLVVALTIGGLGLLLIGVPLILKQRNLE